MRIFPVVLLLLLLAGCSADTSTQALTSCVVAHGTEGRVVSLESHSLAGVVSAGFYFKTDSGDWKEGPSFTGGMRALALHQQELFGLGPEQAAEKTTSDVYDLEGNFIRHIKWDHRWKPIAAASLGENLWVFGLDAPPDNTPEWRPRVINVAVLQDNAWVDRRDLALTGVSLATSDVLVLDTPGNAALQLAWLSSDQAPAVARAAFDGANWQKLPALPLRAAGARLAAAHDGSALLVFVHNGESSITTKNPVLAARIPDGATAADTAAVQFAPIENLADGFLAHTNRIAAAHSAGKTMLFMLHSGGLNMAEIAGHRAVARGSLIDLPLFQRLEAPLTLALMVAAYFVILGLSIRRSRKWPHKVEVEGRQAALAGWKLRVGAFMLDSALVGLVAFVALFNTNADILSQLMTVVVGADSLTAALLWLLWVLYFVLLEKQAGQTFGKWMLGIAVVTTDLKPPRLKHVLIRNLVRLIEPAIVGLVVALNLKTAQRIGDVFAGTLVIRVPRKKSDTEKPKE
ncbi:MAG TPA: RDD family protein [Planctomycetota bacterium]|nr:RDD family protein [Planctomycetota bacterium]